MDSRKFKTNISFKYLKVNNSNKFLKPMLCRDQSIPLFEYETFNTIDCYTLDTFQGRCPWIAWCWNPIDNFLWHFDQSLPSVV